MGFIEETGAAQHYRDAKILSIYEGTTAIQSNDLVGRKTVRDAGAFAKRLAAQIAETEKALIASGSDNAQAVAQQLALARSGFEEAVDFLVANHQSKPNTVYAGSVPFLMLAGNLVAGWQLARSLLISEKQLASGSDDSYGAQFHRNKIHTARFYADHILSRAHGLAHSVVRGHAATTAAVEADYF